MSTENTEIVKKEEAKYIEINPGQFGKAKELAEKIGEILDDKKARNVKIIETNRQTIISDYFVIATGNSSVHIRALAGEIEEQLKENYGVTPARINGLESADWIILDYDSVLAHIFNSEARDYYKLEKLWGEGGGRVDVDGLLMLDKSE
ncbi:MAG: ribosome silencing factor [Oscillospiraceae bacterium]|nr:ribosome silencing factor [Oscillospiraceae bacterium]